MNLTYILNNNYAKCILIYYKLINLLNFSIKKKKKSIEKQIKYVMYTKQHCIKYIFYFWWKKSMSAKVIIVEW